MLSLVKCHTVFMDRKSIAARGLVVSRCAFLCIRSSVAQGFVAILVFRVCLPAASARQCPRRPAGQGEARGRFPRPPGSTPPATLAPSARNGFFSRPNEELVVFSRNRAGNQRAPGSRFLLRQASPLEPPRRMLPAAARPSLILARQEKPSFAPRPYGRSGRRKPHPQGVCPWTEAGAP